MIHQDTIHYDCNSAACRAANGRDGYDSKRLFAWAVSWIESIHGIPMQDIGEREGINDASMWLSLHKAAKWDGFHVCRDPRFR